MLACADVLWWLQSYDVAEFPDLVAKYDKLNWRIISKPGGATVKPDDFYSLYGYASVPLAGAGSMAKYVAQLLKLSV